MSTLNPVSVKPYTLKAGDLLGFKIVAKIYSNNNGEGFWAAYRGLTDWEDEKVASDGDKIPQEVAEALFYAPTALGLIYND
jgi:hypothetical protein